MLVGAATDLGRRSASHADERLHHIFTSACSRVRLLSPLLDDAHYRTVVGDSPDLPAGPTAPAPRLAQPAPPGHPAAAIVDAESSESGEILSAGLHDGHGTLVVSTAAPAPASSSLPSASVRTPADSATQKGAGGIDVSCFIGGGRLNENPLDAHGHQRCRLECAFPASCFESRSAGEVQMSRIGHMEPVAIWDLQGQCLETRRPHLRSPQDCRRTAGLASDQRLHVVRTNLTSVLEQMHHNRVS